MNSGFYAAFMRGSDNGTADVAAEADDDIGFKFIYYPFALTRDEKKSAKRAEVMNYVRRRKRALKAGNFNCFKVKARFRDKL